MLLWSTNMCIHQIKIKIMKKVFFLLTGGLFLSLATMAQTPQTHTGEGGKTTVKSGMKDMRHDIRDQRKDKRQRNEALENGNKTRAKNLNKDIHKDQKDMNTDRKQLRSRGVKHPEKRADHQIRRINERHRG